MHPCFRTATAVVLAAVAFVSPIGPAAASPGHRDWVSRYGAGAQPNASAIVVSGDGAHVFVAGFSTSRLTVIAYDANTGAEVWVSKYGSGPSGPAFASDVTVSQDDSIVVVSGAVYTGTTNWDYATVAYDAATGTELWAKTFDGRASASDQAVAVAIDAQQSLVFVAGTTTVDASTFHGSDYATIAYDAATGSRVWLRRYDGPSKDNDFASDLSLSPNDDRVFVTGGSCCGADSVSEFATVAYDTATGDRLWSRRYDGPRGGYRHDGRIVEASNDGSMVFVTGGSCRRDSCRENYATVAYDAATGVLLWEQIHEGPAIDRSVDGNVAMALSQDGRRIVVAGVEGRDLFATAYRTATGHVLWDRRYDGPAHRIDEATSVVSRGVVSFVSGWSVGATTQRDFLTVAYGLDGERLWLRRYDGGHGDDTASASTATFDGSGVFVTGRSEGASFVDLATLRYAAT